MGPSVPASPPDIPASSPPDDREGDEELLHAAASVSGATSQTKGKE
jgi:hypothetical protein